MVRQTLSALQAQRRTKYDSCAASEWDKTNDKDVPRENARLLVGEQAARKLFANLAPVLFRLVFVRVALQPNTQKTPGELSGAAPASVYAGGRGCAQTHRHSRARGTGAYQTERRRRGKGAQVELGLRVLHGRGRALTHPAVHKALGTVASSGVRVRTSLIDRGVRY